MAVSTGTDISDAGRWRLWFGLLGGVIAWTAHLMLAYLIAEFGCLSREGKATFLGLTVVTWLVLALSAVTLAVAVYATLVADRCRRALPPAAIGADEAGSPGGYLANAGLVLSGLSAFIILVETLPILYYLRDC